MEKPTLYYIHDPMCSWCWGFRKVWNIVQKELTNKLDFQYILGGLAVDTNEIMSKSMQENIQFHWKNIQEKIPETEFNFDFWKTCKPKRSTYPACRAVIAARLQNEKYERKMIYAIQQAYYLNAKNPSEDVALIKMAKDIGLDIKRFSMELNSEKCNYLLKKDLQLVNFLQVRSFPSLVLKTTDTKYYTIAIDYNNERNIINNIVEIIK